MAEERKISLDSIAEGIDTGLSTADSQRGAAFERLGATRKAKDTSLRREQARLSNKYGSNDVRVQLLSNKVANNQEFRVQVAAETIRTKVETPFVDGDTWVLHGFVRNQVRQGVPNLTVAVYDPNGARLYNMGHACTESTGYFRIISKDTDSIGSSVVYVRVLSGSGSFLFADKNALLPQLGRLDYKEISLSGESAVCVSPVEPSGGPASGDSWVVNGQVTNTERRGLPHLTVSIYDKDLIFDDRLGQTATDANGYYKFSYRTHDFRDLIELRPDIYLKVLDHERETLYTSKKTVRFEAGRIETINVVIPSSAISDTQPLTPRIPRDTWVVNGHVTDVQGKPLAHYVVSVYDEDWGRDDLLGTTTTDDTGFYTLSYRTEDFSVFESQPDLYLKVADPNGVTVYSSKEKVRFEAGRVETIDVVVGKDITSR